MLPEDMTQASMNALAFIAGVDSLANPQSAYYVHDYLNSKGYSYTENEVLEAIRYLEGEDFISLNPQAMGSGDFFVKYTLTHPGRDAAIKIQALASEKSNQGDNTVKNTEKNEMSMAHLVLNAVSKQESQKGFTAPAISPKLISEQLDKTEEEVREVLMQLLRAEYLSLTSQAPTFRMTSEGAKIVVGLSSN
jgi:hypothetical protein